MNVVDSRPNFKRANQIADELLYKLNYPIAPIDLHYITQQMNIDIIYESLYGAAGYTFRSRYKDKWQYIMYIAEDMDRKYSTTQIHRRQRYTIAHELGHILLHCHYEDWNNLDEQKDIVEVEANWFASRLLMPDYVFVSIADLSPQVLANKCQVNLLAAKKRLRNLDTRITSQIIEQATDINLSINSIRSLEYDFSWESYFDEIAVSTDILIGE